MDELYAFMDRYIREEFDEEKILKRSSRGTISRIRHKGSHQRYVCRRYSGSVQIYEHLLGIKSHYLPQIFEVAQENSAVISGADPENPAGKTSMKGRETDPAYPGGTVWADAAGTSDGKKRENSIVLEEYILGDTLAMLLQSGPLSAGKVKDIALQICRGLHVLHSLGWIHRDIKPENVMIRGDGAVLIDFDAARYCHSGKNAAGESNRNQDTRILGTVGYAPPEQYGISETDYRADIYAMGVLMNEMLTGEHPSQTLAGGRWGRIISRCTMIQPDRRYNSVEELMEAL